MFKIPSYSYIITNILLPALVVIIINYYFYIYLVNKIIRQGIALHKKKKGTNSYKYYDKIGPPSSSSYFDPKEDGVYDEYGNKESDLYDD